MTHSTDTIGNLVLQLGEIEREMSLLEKAIVLARQSGADWSSERSKLIQLHNFQYNGILGNIKHLIASEEKLNVERSSGMICVFARGNIDADHSNVIQEYEHYATEAGLSEENHVNFVINTYNYSLNRETEIGFVLISKQLAAAL